MHAAPKRWTFFNSFPKDILRDILNVLGLTRSHSAYSLSLPVYVHSVFSPLPDVVSASGACLSTCFFVILCSVSSDLESCSQEARDMCHFNVPAAFSTMGAHPTVKFQMHFKNCQCSHLESLDIPYYKCLQDVTQFR